VKKVHFILFFFSFLFNNLSAQSNNTQSVADGMLFQAIAKDEQGNPAKSRDVHAIVSILNSNTSGSIYYSEKFLVPSGNDGIFTLIIGKGTYTSGLKSNLNDIDWGVSNYFLNIKIAVAPSIGSSGYGIQKIVESISYSFSIEVYILWLKRRAIMTLRFIVVVL
jgi:hypothetical protein